MAIKNGFTRSALFVGLFLALAQSVVVADTSKPNIIVVMTDDHGRWSLAEYDKRIDTPNIGYLAAQGVRFDQAISPTPVCSAARASLYTGRTASQHGVHDFLSDRDSEQKQWLKDETLMSEVLSDNGYRVGLFGKWHADTEGYKPVRGFDRWLTYDERAASWINQYQHSGLVHFSKDGEAITHTGVQARFITASTVDFIDEADERPFAAFVNFVEPHFPFEGLPERLVSKYRPVARDIAAAGDWSSLPASGNHEEKIADHVEKLAQYLAAVTLVDEQVGHLLDALMGRDLLANTLIVFTADHGHQTGQYGLYGKGNSTIPQNLYQDSIDIPLIVYGPTDLVAAGQIRREFVNLYDLFPTLLTLAGADNELEDYDGPGQSLLPLLRGERLTGFRDFQFAEHGNARMVHNGRWKLVRYYQKEADTLPAEYWFDLTHPLGERFPVPPPASAQQQQLVVALETFFTTYETPEHAGRRIWDIPRHNALEIWRR